MTTNYKYATVSECGGRAKPINKFTDIEDRKDFDYSYPELDLTTPMPPNSTIMVESEPVWQCMYSWDTTKYYAVSNEWYEDMKGATANKYRQAYRPITADQQSEGEKEKAFDDTVLLQTMNDTISEMHSDHEFQDKETPSPQPIPGKPASGETAMPNSTQLIQLAKEAYSAYKDDLYRSQQIIVNEELSWQDYFSGFTSGFFERAQWQQSQSLQGVIEVTEDELIKCDKAESAVINANIQIRRKTLTDLLTQIKNLK